MISTADAAGTYQPRTFYVDRYGSDSNAGTSVAFPWRTITHVNRMSFRPGDRILFRGGETFTDAPLMPGDGGVNISGTEAQPIVFSSYGGSVARIAHGIFFTANYRYRWGPGWLTFRNLALGPYAGFEGTGSFIRLQGLQVNNLFQHGSEVGIETEGSNWWIVGNRINGTGDSGMLLGFDTIGPGQSPGGSNYVVTHNVITRTGLDRSLGYGTHGIYSKVTDATITNNRITDYNNDGVSVRYRDANVSRNYIAGGNIGIAWFQYDTDPGRTRFVGNTISNTTNAAIFVCGPLEGCWQPIESFVIAGNHLHNTLGTILNLQPTSGIYRVFRNLSEDRGVRWRASDDLGRRRDRRR
jgi:hypothetical protein